MLINGQMEGELFLKYQTLRNNLLKLIWDIESRHSYFNQTQLDRLYNCIRARHYSVLNNYPHCPQPMLKVFNFMLKIADPLEDLLILPDLCSTDEWYNYRGAVWLRLDQIRRNVWHPKQYNTIGVFGGIVPPMFYYPGLITSIKYLFTDGTFVRNTSDYNPSKTISRYIEPYYRQDIIDQCANWKPLRPIDYCNDWQINALTYQKTGGNIPRQYQPLSELIKGPPLKWQSNTKPQSWDEL